MLRKVLNILPKLSIVLLLILFLECISKCEAKLIPSTDLDTYTITLNGNTLNEVSGLNIFIKLKDNKAAIVPNITFSSQGATSLLSAVTGPEQDRFTLTITLNGKITNGQATITGKFVEGSILSGAEFEVIKIERDGGTDITNLLTTQINFSNSQVVLTPTPSSTPSPTPSPTPNPTAKPTSTPSSTPKGTTDKLIEQLNDKVTINFENIIDNLNNTFIDLFIGFTEGFKKPINISDTVSIEIKNAPEIPDGVPAELKLPEIEEFTVFEKTENVTEIAKGFSLATNILFEDLGESITVSDEELSSQNTAILVDADGKTFVVGFAFLRKVAPGFGLLRTILKKNYKFQTEEGEPLDLTSTITIPADATEGDAKISILNQNESLATIPLRITLPKEVKVGRRSIGKPQISKSTKAILNRNGKQLLLNIKGNNFVRKIATIDGSLERLIGKATFTNVTFVPPESIKIKSIKVARTRIIVKAEIQDNVTPGIKLFNVITPKGADIGAVIFPDPVTVGNLDTTINPESLILNTGN